MYEQELITIKELTNAVTNLAFWIKTMIEKNEANTVKLVSSIDSLTTSSTKVIPSTHTPQA